jgi:hypothetical protein
MSTVKTVDKTAPINFTPDSDEYIKWATADVDDNVTAGWVDPNPPRSYQAKIKLDNERTINRIAGDLSVSLLHQIATRANFASVAKKNVQSLVASARSEKIGFTLNVDPETKMRSASYMIPARNIIAASEGTPEELLEWLKSGLASSESVSLTSAKTGKQYLNITQTHAERI